MPFRKNLHFDENMQLFHGFLIFEIQTSEIFPPASFIKIFFVYLKTWRDNSQNLNKLFFVSLFLVILKKVLLC